MTSNLQIFNSSDFGQIRTVMVGGEPWFVGKDVAAALEYSNTRDAIRVHVDEEDKNTVAIHDGIKGNPNQVIINESGLYSLILSSKLPSAKKFKRWVTSEVLPTLRKTGSYQMPGTGSKTTSIGDVINLIRITRETMKDQGSDPKDIAQTVKGLCDQFNIQLPDCFVKPEETKLSDVLDMVDYIYQSGHTRKPTYNDYIIHLTVSRLEDKGGVSNVSIK